MHKDDKGNWVPNYVIKSPRECKTIIVKPEDLKYRVLMIHKDKKDLKGTNVLKYIQWGERKGYHKRPTCASRNRWYDLGEWYPYKVLFTMYFQQSYKYHLNLFNCFVDHTLYECESSVDDINKIIVLYFNSTIAFLYPDILGRSYGGGGAPTGFMVYEVEKLPVLNPRKILENTKKTLLAMFETFKSRDFGTVFDELGSTQSKDVTLDKIKPDRRELDKIIMGEILGLTDEEQLEIYRAVVDLVNSRIKKAKDKGKKKKSKEGIDIELLVKNLVSQLGDNTLGRFYREKILTKPCYEKTLPEIEGKIKIEKDLFKWRLRGTNAFIECETEIEAEYLKNFIGMGLDTIKIPNDEKYLKKILPELSALREKIDKVIEEEVLSILSPKTQREVLHLLWQEVMKTEE